MNKMVITRSIILFLSSAGFSFTCQQEEKYELEWKYKKGEVFKCRWIINLKSNTENLDTTPFAQRFNNSLTAELTGSFKIDNVSEEGDANAVFHIDKYHTVGAAAGNKLELLFEDGVIKKMDSKLLDADPKKISIQLNTDVKVTMGKYGKLSLEQNAGFNLFDGLKKLYIGPSLPDKALIIGEYWDDSIETISDSPSVVNIKNKVEKLIEYKGKECIHITASNSETKETKVDKEKSMVDVKLTRDALFSTKDSMFVFSKDSATITMALDIADKKQAKITVTSELELQISK